MGPQQKINWLKWRKAHVEKTDNYCFTRNAKKNQSCKKGYDKANRKGFVLSLFNILTLDDIILTL